MRIKDLYVFELSNSGTFEAIGDLNQYTSLIWPDAYRGFSHFTLWAPITDYNRSLLQPGRILWGGDTVAVQIEIISSERHNNGKKYFEIRGRSLEAILTQRIILGTYRCSNKPSSTVMYELVDSNFVNPKDPARKIPFLECSKDTLLGKSITYQKTGGEVYDALIDISSASDLGFDLVFNPRDKKLIFTVTEGVDHSILSEGAKNSPVVLSSDLEDIVSSKYYHNSQDYKSVAYVAGEGEGSSRVVTTSGDPLSSGFTRKELYVDARDLQSQEESPDSYLEALSTRGDEKLSNHRVTESFEADIRILGGQYTYGVDYQKGDKVIIQDKDLGVQVYARVTEATQTYDESYGLSLTFGYSYPTLSQKLKQQLS